MTSAALVIGGGPAGAMVAITLARRDREVLLVERESKPQHKVCGEFLSQEALHYLQSIDIAPEKLGAVAIRAVRFTHEGRTVEAALPFAAMSLTRRKLDEELLRRACVSGATVLRGCSVESLKYEVGRWKAELASADTLQAQDVFMATGKHDLRGHSRPAGKQRDLIAFKMYWKFHPEQDDALREHVELIAYRGGYAGLQPVECGATNLCCLIDSQEYRRLGGSWSNLLASIREQSPHLHTRLHNAEPLLQKPLAIASLPYGMVRQHTEGLWHLGDQAAVIPSFTGDGMSLALHSGKLAAETYLHDGTAQDFQRQFAKQADTQISVATTLSKLVVSNPKLALAAMRLSPGALKTIGEQTRIRPTHLLS